LTLCQRIGCQERRIKQQWWSHQRWL